MSVLPWFCTSIIDQLWKTVFILLPWFVMCCFSWKFMCTILCLFWLPCVCPGFGEKLECAGQASGASTVFLGTVGWPSWRLPQSAHAESDWSWRFDGGVPGLWQQGAVSRLHLRLNYPAICFSCSYGCLYSPASSGMMSASRMTRSQVTGTAVCPPSRPTDVGAKPCWTCCLMACGSSWWAGWRSWFSSSGKAAPQVGGIGSTSLRLLKKLWRERCYWVVCVVSSQWQDFWEPGPCAAGLPELLHAALHDACDGTQGWPQQGASHHCWPALPGQSAAAFWLSDSPEGQSRTSVYKDHLFDLIV